MSPRSQNATILDYEYVIEGGIDVNLFKPTGSRYWYFSWTHPDTGERVKKSTKQEGKALARCKAENHIKEIMAATVGGRVVKHITFEDAVPLYLEAAAYKKTENTIVREKRVIKILRERWGGHRLSDITLADIIEFQQDRQRAVKGRTVNANTLVLAALLRWAADNDHIATLPYKKIPKVSEADSERRKVLTRVEVGAVLEVSGKWGNPMIDVCLRLAAYAGLRLGETLSLDWKSVDLDAGVIHIEARNSKSKKHRAVPISPILRETLEPIARDEGSVLGLKDPHSVIWKIFKRAEVEGSMHSLRHTFGTELANSGTPLNVVQEIMGHADIKTTMGYLHTTQDQAAKAVARLDFGGKPGTVVKGNFKQGGGD